MTPSLHGVFDAVLEEWRAKGPLTREQAGWRDRILTTVLGIAFFGFVGGVSYLAYTYAIGPGEETNTQRLDDWIVSVREGRGTLPTHAGPTTSEAMRAISTSRSHNVANTRGSYDFDGTGTTCFDVVVAGPNGPISILVRIQGESGRPIVTEAGMRPPCACGRNGALNGCS